MWNEYLLIQSHSGDVDENWDMLQIKTWGFRVLDSMVTNEYITTMFYTSSLDNNTYTTNLKYPQILIRLI